MKNAVKWHLGMLLESGTLTWSTLTGQRSQALLRFARWLESLPDPAAAVGDVQQAGTFAAAFRRWACEPSNRTSAGRPPAAVSAGKVNLDLWSVAGLMDFLAGHRQEAARDPRPVALGRADRARTPLSGSGSARGYGAASPSTMRPVTSMITPSRRSPPACPCSASRLPGQSPSRPAAARACCPARETRS